MTTDTIPLPDQLDEARAQVAADLRAAAEVLRRDGWAQNELTAASGAHCAIGAICQVTDYSVRASAALCAHLGGQSLTDWNDAPGRTADEVIAALEAAADAEASR